jgi:HK97 family phage portal protein
VSLVATIPTGRGVLTRDGAIVPPSASTLTVPGPYVYDAQSARRVPAVGRAIQLYGGLVKQMPMDAYRGDTRLPQPRLLSAPDPYRGGPWFVQNSVEDYLLNGNAISLITARGVDGWPLAAMWLPAAWVYIIWDPWVETNVRYYYIGQELNIDDVVHVRRGADRWYPVRGVGVVEEYLSTLDRAAMEEEYERTTLAGSAVPSVAVIAPQATVSQDVADEAKDRWTTKFAGPVREPVILPNGTQVIPLAWSPTDTQLIEARKLTLLDVANMFNLDGYWLGSPVAGLTYKTAAPQYQQILRTSLEPVLADVESIWSAAWLPRGTTVRFRRSQLLQEDLATAVTAAAAAYNAGLATLAEARSMIGLPPAAVGALAPAGLPNPSSAPSDTVDSPADSADLEEGDTGGTP